MTRPQINAKIIADSISTHGARISTFELEYQRFIHAEFFDKSVIPSGFYLGRTNKRGYQQKRKKVCKKNKLKPKL